MSAIRNGWQAEAFVAKEMAKRDETALMIPLAPAYPADFIRVFVGGAALTWEFVEVKSSRRAAKALRAKLTDAEAALRKEWPFRYLVVRVLTRPGGPCEILQESYEP